MSANVTPEELEALGEGARIDAAPAPEPRDFHQPHRLSEARRSAIRGALNKLAPELEATVRTWLQGDYAVALADLGETSALGLFDALEDPIVVRNLTVRGAQGWVVWENQPAIHAATAALSCEPKEDLEARPLTPIEGGVVGDFLADLVSVLSDPLGLSVQPGALSQDERSFLSLLETNERGDAQRLYVHLELDGPGGPSTIRVYLPGVLPESHPEPPEVHDLPHHLDEVPIEVSADLDVIDVDINDLMKLEPGDVIPLSRSVGDPVELRVEGRLAGQASLGSHKGRLALRIESMNPNL